MANTQEALSYRPAWPHPRSNRLNAPTIQLESLQRKINEIRVENCSMQHFVPDDKLREIISEDSIESVLGDVEHSYMRRGIIRYVLERAVKVFAVLVVIGKPSRMQDFMTHDYSLENNLDHQRPFNLQDLKRIFRDDLVVAGFFDKQWEFWPPHFSGDVLRREFQPKTIFPFVKELPLAKGGFGIVTRIWIHPLYRPPSFQDVEVFVRKELPLLDLTFEREAHTLSVLQELKHPNILPLVSCYTFGPKHHLISPYKEEGNLKQLLERERTESLPREELLFSLAGISSALWALHDCVPDEFEPRLKGLHQDLNPDNILVDRNRFILADFGLSSLKNLSANSRTPFRGRRGYYQAPECADLAPPYDSYDATRATDIWSIACMMSELLVHFVRGVAGVKEFQQDREFEIRPIRFAGLFHKGNVINEAVHNWLERMSEEDGSRSMQQLTRLVRNMLEITPECRPEAHDVTVELYRITIEAFLDNLLLIFCELAPSCEVLIEKSRTRAWHSCQSTNVLSFAGATKEHEIFETTIDLLRQLTLELATLKKTEETLDSRALWQVRSLNSQLSSMLPSDRRSNAQSLFETFLLGDAGSVGLDLKSPDAERALGSGRISQMVHNKSLVMQTNNSTVLLGQLTFRELAAADFIKDKRNDIPVARLKQSRDSPTETLLLESVPYEDSQTGRRLLPRYRALCTLLSRHSKELRTPTLFALCNNQDALCYDLLYEFPKNRGPESSQISPITLYRLLAEREVSKYPSLDRRFGLALKLSEAVAVFHDLEWFHKDLTSSNILFFPHAAASAVTRSSEPYLCGFGNSRKESDDFTQGPLHNRKHHRYHFPGYVSVQEKRFTKFVRHYDWYSLGVVLIEIGFWRQLDSLMAELETADNDAYANDLRDVKLQSLSFHCGEKYAEVVRFCLDSPRRIFELNIEPNAIFKKKVVQPLQTLATRFPESPKPTKRKAVRDDDDEELQFRSVRQRHE